MSKPTLIVMAAGMGSRYGGLKQIDPVTDQNEIIMDFSLYDALLAGFDRAVFVIKEEMKKDFEELIENRSGKHMETHYVCQSQDDLPEGYKAPEGREKPWGTSHAIYSARDLIDGPFAVINADDYYGPGAFTTIYDYLKDVDNAAMDFCMVSYTLKNTITENGHVARGICEVYEDGTLSGITERTKIMRRGDAICYTEDDGETWVPLAEDSRVSMNFWGFTPPVMKAIGDSFPAFLDETLKTNPLKGEFLIPTTVDELISAGRATVTVLESHDKWYGVTYREDKPLVVAALQSMKDKGIYPEKLWK